MGIWNTIGNIAKIAGAGVATAATGGAAAPLLIGAIGNVASNIAQGRAQGRVQEAGINANQDILKQRQAALMEEALQNRGNLDLSQKKMLEDALAQRAQTDLQQRQFALTAPQARAKNSVKGDMLANLQDVSVHASPRVQASIPQISGGLRPSMLSGNSRALGADMSRQALMQQMEGDHFDKPGAMPTFDKMPAPQIPGVTPTPQSGGLDTFLNTVGGVGAGAGFLADALKNRYKVPQYGQAPNVPTGDWEQGVG